MLQMRCVGKGVYHVGPGGIEKPGDFGWRVDSNQTQIALYCPKFGVCFQKVSAGGPDPNNAIWGWDGEWEHPTVLPSIGCDTPPRCGQHLTIIAGTIQGCHEL